MIDLDDLSPPKISTTTKLREPSQEEILTRAGLSELAEVGDEITAAPHFNSDVALDIIKKTYSPANPGFHGFADVSYIVSALADVMNVQRDENVLYINPDICRWLMYIVANQTGWTADKLIEDQLCRGVAPNVNTRVITRDDFPIASRGAPFQYRAIAFGVPASDLIGEDDGTAVGVGYTNHFAALIYFVHGHEGLEGGITNRVLLTNPEAGFTQSGVISRPVPAYDPALQAAFDARFRGAGGRGPMHTSSRPRLYYYDSLGMANRTIAKKLADVLAVTLKLFDARCISERDYEFIEVTSRKQEHVGAYLNSSCGTWSISFAMKAAMSSMRRNFTPYGIATLGQMQDRCANDVLKTFYDRFAALSKWYLPFTKQGELTARVQLDDALSNLVTLPLGLRKERLVDFLMEVYYGRNYAAAYGNRLHRREGFANTPKLEFINPDFMRLYLAADLAVPDNVVFVTSRKALANEWAQTVEAFSRLAPTLRKPTDLAGSGPGRAMSRFPRLFLWLYLPGDEEDDFKPAGEIGPALIGFMPVYSLSQRFVRVPSIFVQAKTDNVQLYKQELIERGLLESGIIADLEPDGDEARLVPPYFSTITFGLTVGDKYASLVLLARSYARMDGYVLPGGAIPNLTHASGFLNTRSREQSDYTEEVYQFRSTMFGRVMELLALNANPRVPRYMKVEVANRDTGGLLDFDARDLVMPYSAIRPADGVDFNESELGALRRQWAFLYNNTPLFDCVRTASDQLSIENVQGNGPNLALAQLLSSPCCGRRVKRNESDPRHASVAIVYEHWVELLKFAKAENMHAAAWISSLALLAGKGAAELIRATRDADILQFPVVIHGRTVGPLDRAPVVFGLVHILAALHLSEAFAAWLNDRMFNVGDLITYPTLVAGVLSGPDIFHQDPYLHIVVSDFSDAKSERVARNLSTLLYGKKSFGHLAVPTTETPNQDPSALSIMQLMSYNQVALLVAAFALAV